MKRTVALFIAFVFLVSAAIFPVHAMEGHDETAITFLSGKRGYSTISYNPSSYEYCKGNLVVNSNGSFEYDESGIIPVITLATNNEITFSYDSSNIRDLWDDPVQQVLNIPLGASVRSGAVIVQKKVSTNNYQTMSIAVDVFREGAASLAGFFKPDYTDILKGATYQIIVAYATVAKNQTQIQHVVEIYEVKLQVNSLGVSFVENLPDSVITNALENIDSAKALELYRIGGTLSDLSVTPYGFSVNFRNPTTKVELSFNKAPFRNVTDQETFAEIGQYTFKLSSCSGNERTITIFITPPKDKFMDMYFPEGIITGTRLWDITSDIPIFGLGAKIARPEPALNRPQLYGTLHNVDTGETCELSSLDNTIYYLNKPGCYFVFLRNTPSEETPGTRVSYSYVFQITSPSDPYTTFNLQNLRNSNIISSYKAQHWEVDLYESNKLIHLCFSSAEAARNIAAQYDTVAQERFWDYTMSGTYSRTDAAEEWLWANTVEREMAKSNTQMLHPGFVFVPCETQEVRAYEYATGSIKRVEFGIPVQQQFAQGRHRIIEIQKSGERIEYDVYYADGVNRVSYSLHYDGKSYMVSGERMHCVNSQGPVTITDILNRWDSEGIIKVENGTETLVLPIAQTTDITLEGGFFRLQLFDRMGNTVELEMNSASSALTNLAVAAENPVGAEAATVSNRQFWGKSTFITLVSICGVGCFCGSIICIKTRRKRRK